MNIIKRDWTCVPDNPKHKYAICFAISDNLSFALANVIIGLNLHSPSMMEQCDVLIYSNDISSKNKQLISQLHDSTFFMGISYPESMRCLVEDPWAIKKGYNPYIYCKLFGFWLIHKYEKVLFLDVDILIRGDISGLFGIEEYFAWRRILAYNPNEALKDVLKTPDLNISVGNGGLILFSDKLRTLGIDFEKEIAKWAPLIVNAPGGGHDEKIFGCIAYEHSIPVKELDSKVYNTPIRQINDKTLLVHFVAPSPVNPKPWLNLAAYLYFDDWREFHYKWIEMGGDNPTNYTKDDYFKLFGFDNVFLMKKLQKKVDMKNTRSEEQEKEYKVLEAKYNDLLNSKVWKLTAPLRKIAEWFRKLMKKYKKQH